MNLGFCGGYRGLGWDRLRTGGMGSDQEVSWDKNICIYNGS